jgi:hypothetical protein
VIASLRKDEPDQRERMAAQQQLATTPFGGKLVVAAQMKYRELDIGEAQVVLDVDAVTGRVIRAARRRVLYAAGIRWASVS